METDNLPIQKIEVNMKNFFIEWWKLLQRTKVLKTHTQYINKVFKIEDPNKLLEQIYFLEAEDLNNFFRIFFEIQQFTINGENDVLEDKYTMFLKIF